MIPVQVKPKEGKKGKKRASHEDILTLQYECLTYKRENLLLKKRKLELEVQLLEEQLHSAAMSSVTNYHVI